MNELLFDSRINDAETASTHPIHSRMPSRGNLHDRQLRRAASIVAERVSQLREQCHPLGSDMVFVLLGGEGLPSQVESLLTPPGRQGLNDQRHFFPRLVKPCIMCRDPAVAVFGGKDLVPVQSRASSVLGRVRGTLAWRSLSWAWAFFSSRSLSGVFYIRYINRSR